MKPQTPYNVWYHSPPGISTPESARRYVPVDPFAPSIAFSLNNYLLGFLRPTLLAETIVPSSHSKESLGEWSSGARIPSRTQRPSPVPSRHSVEPEHGRLLPSVRTDDEAVEQDEESTPALGPPPRPAWRTAPLPTHRRSHSMGKVITPLRVDFLRSDPPDVQEHSSFPRTSKNTPTYALALAFLLDTIPRQIYLHIHLRLPYLYYSRVTRIFEEAEMTVPMIMQEIIDSAENYSPEMRFSSHRNALPFEPSGKNLAYSRLKDSWEFFIDSLVKEWKTLNIISVLLLSTILTVLQIESAASDPITRYAALTSMICSLMSLIYGCTYIIRFGSMRKPHKGAAWAEEAQKFNTGIFWNVWVLLAMPAIWLAWSMILFITTIMSFVWRTSPIPTDVDTSSLTETSAQILVPRIIISSLLGLGVVYFICIATTLRRYGTMMDRAWQTKIWEHISRRSGLKTSRREGNWEVNGWGDAGVSWGDRTRGSKLGAWGETKLSWTTPKPDVDATSTPSKTGSLAHGSNDWASFGDQMDVGHGSTFHADQLGSSDNKDRQAVLRDPEEVRKLITSTIAGMNSVQEMQYAQSESAKMLTSNADVLIQAICQEFEDSVICRRCMQPLDSLHHDHVESVEVPVPPQDQNARLSSSCDTILDPDKECGGPS